MAAQEATVTIKETLPSKWKAVEVDKENMGKFLTEQGVPLLINKALTTFATSGTIECKFVSVPRRPLSPSPRASGSARASQGGARW